jgi:hypothetical protein
MISRYLLDDSRLEPDDALALHRSVLAWAAERSDRFVLSVDRTVTDATVLDRLSRLRESAATAQDQRAWRVEGVVDDDVVAILIDNAAPTGAIAGDLSPVEDLSLHSAGRRLFAAADYGRTQLLELDQDERASLVERLLRDGHEPDVLRPAPPYVTGTASG